MTPREEIGYGLDALVIFLVSVAELHQCTKHRILL